MRERGRKETRGKGREPGERDERAGSWGRGSERPLGSRWLFLALSLLRKKSAWYSVMHTNSRFLPTSGPSRGGKNMEA